MAEPTWTVVRFPNGSWSYGGRMDAPEYALCEKWAIEATSGNAAVKKAQSRRSRELGRARAALGVDDVAIEVTSSCLTLDDDEIGNLVQEHTATIFLHDELVRPRQIGELAFDLVDVGAMMKTGDFPLDVLDDTNAEGAATGSLLFRPDGYAIRLQLLQHVEPLHHRFLHLRELFVEPKWRGRKFGIAALHILLKRYSRGCDFAVLCASPIRVDVVSEADRMKQQNSLRKLYEQVGFKRVGRTLYMVRDLLDYDTPGCPFGERLKLAGAESKRSAL